MSTINQVDALRDSLDSLNKNLKTLIEAVKNVNHEIMALQPLLEATNVPAPDKEEKASVAEPQSQAFLEAINTLPIPELTVQLKGVNAKKNVIKNILNERKNLNFQPFTSIDDLLMRIKGLGKQSLDKLVSQWT